MDFIQIKKVRKRYLRYPSAVYGELESKHYCMPVGETEDHDSWVTARFSPHRSQEHLLYMGDDPGNIGIFDVRKYHDRAAPLNERQVHFFPAHDGAIMDIVGVPHKESNIVSISGDTTVRCWDLNQSAQDRTSQLFSGHEGSVRSICFAPDDPNVFATGARDGQVKIWDMRITPKKENDEEFRTSLLNFTTAHPSSQIKKPAVGTPKSKAKIKYVGSSVTSVIFLDEHHVATASSSSESGIRVWDIRKPVRNEEGQPARVLKVPSSPKQKSFGITCLALDRFGNRLFASCTNSTIFEYSVPTTNVTPINTYSGATIRDYYTQIACSPVSDVIACGSEDQRALIWDLQDQYSYMNDFSLADEIDKRRTQFPRWSCGEHLKKVQNVGWSAQGRYFMSFDEGGVRIWAEPRERKKWHCCDHEEPYPEAAQHLGLSYAEVKPYEMTLSDSAMACIDSISLSPRQRSDSGVIGSPQKSRGEKRPIVKSPFKPINRSPEQLRLNMSPMNKKSKLSSSPNHFEFVAGYQTPQSKVVKKKRPFHYTYPTEHLPNLVYDKFIQSMLGESTGNKPEMESLSKTSRKRLEDWWQVRAAAETVSTATRTRLPSVSEFGESACDQVISETERIAQKSPRKLVVPFNPKPLLSIPQTPKTPRKPRDKRPTSRNLMHYFKKSE